MRFFRPKRSEFLPFLFLAAAVPAALAGGCHSPNADDGQCSDSCDCGGTNCTTPPFPETVTYSSVRPPPLSGGTLLMSRDGTTALASDPDRDRILVVDTSAGVVLQSVPTSVGAQPGPAVEDSGGR